MRGVSCIFNAHNFTLLGPITQNLLIHVHIASCNVHTKYSAIETLGGATVIHRFTFTHSSHKMFVSECFKDE